MGVWHGWAQAKSDTDDPNLRTPEGANRQIKYRALGSAIMLVLLVVLVLLFAVIGD